MALNKEESLFISRLEARLGFRIRKFIREWPNNPDARHWILDARILHFRGRKRAVVRSLFEIIAGEELHETHMTRNTCGQAGCINPAHNQAIQRNLRAVWAPKPLPIKLMNSSLNDDEEVEDILDLLEGTGITDPTEAFTYLDEQYELHLIERALSK